MTNKGKVLKIRLGYNANSSSIAAIVSIFLWGSAIAVTIINTAAAVFFLKTEKNLEESAHETSQRTV